MLTVIDMILIVGLLGCLIYIYWLHQKNAKQTKKQHVGDKQINTQDDEISFLKSDYNLEPIGSDDSIFSDGSMLSTGEL